MGLDKETNLSTRQRQVYLINIDKGSICVGKPPGFWRRPFSQHTCQCRKGTGVTGVNNIDDDAVYSSVSVCQRVLHQGPGATTAGQTAVIIYVMNHTPVIFLLCQNVCREKAYCACFSSLNESKCPL